MPSILTFLIVSSLMVFNAFGEEVSKQVESQLSDLLFAAWTSDIELFESHCDKSMKIAMTAEKLAEFSKQISPFMVLGCEREFMGVLDKGTLKVYYWKFTFHKTGVPDMLAELSIGDDRVAAFQFR